LSESVLHHSGDQMPGSEMGAESSTYGGKLHTGFRWEELRGIDHLEDLGENWRIVL